MPERQTVKALLMVAFSFSAFFLTWKYVDPCSLWNLNIYPNPPTVFFLKILDSSMAFVGMVVIYVLFFDESFDTPLDRNHSEISKKEVVVIFCCAITIMLVFAGALFFGCILGNRLADFFGVNVDRMRFTIRMFTSFSLVGMIFSSGAFFVFKLLKPKKIEKGYMFE
jgi:hypothetical protein